MRENLANNESTENNKENSLINREKEQAFEKMRESLKGVLEQGGEMGIRELFLMMFNPALEASNETPLTIDDVKSLSLLEVDSKSASEIVGEKIIRPIFVFTDISEFQKFSEKLQGERGVGSRGIVMGPSMFPEESLSRKTGLIVATASNDFLSHEVRHTVDLNINERQGADKLLAEIFAYYQKTIVESKPEQYRHIKNPEDGPWNRLVEEAVIDYNARKEEIRISLEEYKNMAKKAVQAIRDIAKKWGHIEAQRAIIKSKTIEELITKSIL